MTFGYRGPRAHYVRIASIDEKREPAELFSNLCEKRLLYSKLIAAVTAAAPALIVIDARFGSESCPKKDKGTEALIRSVREALENEVPVVIGIDSDTKEELRRRDQSGQIPLRDGELLSTGGLDFGPSSPDLIFGHVRLNADVRKIPLYWPTYFSLSEAESHQHPKPLPGLSFAATRLYDNLLEEQPRLTWAIKRGVHPYSSFIEERQFPTYEALDLICGAPNVPANRDWENCVPGEYGRPALRGHVVVIGERTESEFRDSVVGSVPGYILQANYIESLLDDRYFPAVRTWVQILLSLALFALIEAVFTLQADFPERALGLAVCIVVGAWTVSWLVLLVGGFYVVAWLPGLLAIIGKYADCKFEGKEKSNVPKADSNQNVALHAHLYVEPPESEEPVVSRRPG